MASVSATPTLSTFLQSLAATNNGANSAATTQKQLQSLDIALQALGLSPQNIQQLNHVATVINDFNPAAFAALVYQFQALAQETVQQAAASPAGGQNGTAETRTAGRNIAANGTAAAGTAANGGAFHVQELIVKFSGVNSQETAQSNGSASGGTQGGAANAGFQVSAFKLQIEEVNLTFASGNGQTTQIIAPIGVTNAAISAATLSSANTIAVATSA